jgi:hypothetical protein
LSDPRSRRAVDVAEMYVERAATEEELSAAEGEAGQVAEEIDEALGEAENYSLSYYAALATYYCAMPATSKADSIGVVSHCAFYALRAVESHGESETQGRLLCDILSRPPSLLPDPSWLTPAVVTLARTIYDDRAFHDLPILADALLDAGCDNEDVLAHCRGPGPHVRGCWVIDLILGKQ